MARINYDPTKIPNQNNYFTNIINRFNGDEDFVWRLKPEQIQKSAKDRIFREMIRGQIDYSLYGKYYLDTKFMENLIVAAKDELNNNIIIYNALNYEDLNIPGIPEVIAMKYRYNCLVYIYQVIVNKLEQCKFTGNVGVLNDIQYILGQQFKNFI